MRIIGGKDYYDGAMGFGQDPDLVFARKRHEDADPLKADKTGLEDLHRRDIRLSFPNGRPASYFGDGDYRIDGIDYTIRPVAVWFAGERHGGFSIDTRDRRTWANTRRHLWSHPELIEALEEIGLRPTKRHSGRFYRSALDEVGVAEHFASEGTAAAKAWIIDNRVHVAIWEFRFGVSGWKIDTDGLKLIDFARHVDPWTAFQDLSMYAGGVLPRQANPIVEITSERTMVAKHGFDEWSFRRPSKVSRG